MRHAPGSGACGPVWIATSIRVARSRKCCCGDEHGDGDLALGVHAHDALAALAGIRQHRSVDRLAAEAPATGDQRRVVLLDLALPQQRVQHAQRRPRPGHQQAAAGVAIEAVRELERLGRAQRAQCLDGAECEARSAVHREPRRLVQHQDPLILVHDGRAHRREQSVRDRARRLVVRRAGREPAAGAPRRPRPGGNPPACACR